MRGERILELQPCQTTLSDISRRQDHTEELIITRDVEAAESINYDHRHFYVCHASMDPSRIKDEIRSVYIKFC